MSVFSFQATLLMLHHPVEGSDPQGIIGKENYMFLGRQDDAVTVAPEVHTVVFENDAIRVLDVVVPAGYKSGSHWHPKNMGYVLVPGTLRFTLPDGVVKDVELSLNQVTQGEGAHIVENTGSTEVRVMQIEFKD